MSTIEMRRKARRKIQKLSPRDLRTALDFLDSLEARDEEDATEELERIPHFAEAMAKAEREVAAGRVTQVEKLGRKYKRHA
jgi:hypothetical protein